MSETVLSPVNSQSMQINEAFLIASCTLGRISLKSAKFVIKRGKDVILLFT